MQVNGTVQDEMEIRIDDEDPRGPASLAPGHGDDGDDAAPALDTFFRATLTEHVLCFLEHYHGPVTLDPVHAERCEA
jgi:hypothetical protein